MDVYIRLDKYNGPFYVVTDCAIEARRSWISSRDWHLGGTKTRAKGTVLRITRGENWRLPPATSNAALQKIEAAELGESGSVGLRVVREADQAAALLSHPLRLRILAALREPDSATGVARRMNLPRQTVNYHVRELARARLLARAGRRRRRHLYEQRYVATARGYVLSPELLGKLAADPAQVTDALSASYLLGLASKVQSEVIRSAELAPAAGKRLVMLSMNTELRFVSPEQCAVFAEDLQRTILEVTARHSAPLAKPDVSAGDGRPYRLVVGCYPIPPAREADSE